MAQAADLRALTLRYFEYLNLSELNCQWVEEINSCHFTDVEDSNVTLSILFTDNGVTTLNKLAELCLAWCDQPAEGNSVQESNASVQESVLWTFLNEVGITVKHIRAFIYVLCDKAKRSLSAVTPEHSSDLKAYGLSSAKLYFNCLRVSGSSAYNVYDSNLFCLCIDCLYVPDLTVDKDSVALRELEEHSTLYITALTALIPLLKEFHLGNDYSIIEHVIKMLAELAGCETHNHIQFDQNLLELGEGELRRRYKITFAISSLAYQAFFSILESDLNFDKNYNHIFILHHLSPYIRCAKARKSSTISQKHLIARDNAVAFFCHNLKNPELNTEVVRKAVARLCRGGCDRADFRATLARAVLYITLHMKSEDKAKMIKFFLLLVDSAEAKERTLALDILSLLLKTYGDGTDTVSDSLKPVMTLTPIIFSILTRCDDFSPVLRKKALNILSENIKIIFEFLEKTKNQGTFEFDEPVEDDVDLEVNGNRRFFWYNLETYKNRLNEVACILQRRVDDFNCVTRVAALSALGNLVMFHMDFLTEENLKFFHQAMKDDNIIVRKQMIDSLTGILSTYRNNAVAQEYFLKCVLPLLQDSEDSVFTKALSVLEDLFLQKVYSNDESHVNCSFTLIKKLCTDFLTHQRYLQKAFHQWKVEKKLKVQNLVQLEKYLETEWQLPVWFLFSSFSAHCILPSKIYDRAIEHLEKFQSCGSNHLGIIHMLKVLTYALPDLPKEKLEIVKNIVKESLESLNTPIQIIPEYIEILSKVHKILLTEEEFKEFTSILFKECESTLLEIKSRNSFRTRPSEELLAKHFCIIKELCLINSAFIQRITPPLKAFAGCGKASATLSRVLTPKIKAHAYAALGKLCLLDEILAKDLLTVFARELLSSKHDVIRNNLVIILLEMCKRYTSLADRYVPLISLCFKDKVYLIRYQTILLVVNLLQEGYIKWKGALFFCLVSTLVDEEEDIQELGHYSLTHLLQDKKKNLFSEHFIDSIFVFNSFPPPGNDTVAQIVKEFDRFCLKGESKRPERLVLYKFLLAHMDDNEKAYLVNQICEILTNLAEGVYPLNHITECMIRDCFAILNSRELLAFEIGKLFDRMEEENQEELLCEALTETRKIVVIQPVLPVIVSLRNAIINPKSDLMNDIIVFLKEMLVDFKEELKKLLAMDVILLRQLELEFMSDAERERVEARVKSQKCSVKPADEPKVIHNTIESIRSLLEQSQLVLSPEKDRKEEKSGSPNQQTPKGSQIRVTRQGAYKSTLSPSSSDSHITHNIVSAVVPEKNKEGRNEKKPAAANQQIPKVSRTTRKRNRRAGKNSPRPSNSNSSITYNIVSDTPFEASDQRFTSTPRIRTGAKVPTGRLNLSAIEKPTEAINELNEDV